MKKLFALLLAGVLCLSAAACDDGGTDTLDTDGATVGVTDTDSDDVDATTDESEGETTAPDAPNAPTYIFGASELLAVDPTTGSGILNAVANDNYVTYTLSGNNSYYQPLSNAKGDRVLSVKYRTSSADLAYVQLSIGSAGSEPTGDDSMLKEPIVADGEWHLMIFDLAEVPGYDGENVSYFRFGVLATEQSPLARDGAAAELTIDVEYVAFFSSEERAMAYEGDGVTEDDATTTDGNSATDPTEPEVTTTEPEETTTEPEETTTEPEETTTAPETSAYSKGLAFTSNGDGTCYVSGIGTCTDVNVSIPPVSPNGDRVTSIGASAFFNRRSIASVVIPGGVTSIGDQAFSTCHSLTSITIPPSVKTIGDKVFTSCIKLTDVYIDDLAAWCNIDFVDNHSNPLAFVALKKLKAKLYLNGILVTELVIPDGVTRIKDYAFSNCSFLTSVTIPDGVTSIGDCAFEYCSSLTSVVIPDSVTSMGDCVFKRCSSLTSVIISNNVATIGIRAFGDCSSLTSIVIPNGVTSIGEYAFNTCESLTNITIPNSVTSMGNRVFYDCAALTDVYYTGSAAQWAKISMDEDDVALLASVNIHYGDASDEDITEPEYAEGDVVIRTAEDLMAFNQSVNDYYFGYYEFITVHLAADIDLSGYEWIPLYGDNLSEVTFDGHGYTISNMYIPYNLDGNLTNRGDLMLGAGFVGVVTQNLYFKNLNFDHCSVEAYERHVGCVVGRNLSGLVVMENVNVTNFTGDGWYDFDNRGNRGTAFRVAGLMGANQSQASFENCHVENVKLTGYHSLAGLVGFDQSGSLDESCFVDCSVENLECYFGYGMKYNVSQAQKYVAAFCNFDGFVDKTDACVASGNTYENVRYFDIADNNREYTPDNFRSTNG